MEISAMKADVDDLKASPIITPDVRPGDIVQYDDEPRLKGRYIGKAANGFDVIEYGYPSRFTTWLPGKMRLPEPTAF